MRLGDTIAAVSTPPGEGAIAVIRLSGRDAAGIAARVFRRPGRATPFELDPAKSHRLFHGAIVDPVDDHVIDDVLLAWMAGPRTFTGEDTVEISCHGGAIPVAETLRAMLAAGARQAEPGEFTLRAFVNGRLDLTRAEAVLQIVHARTAAGLRLAVEDLGGEFTARLAPARDAVIRLLAYLDAAADFPDDEIPAEDVDADLALAVEAVETIVRGSRMGQLYRDGVTIALAGKPNVGKSSLMNALLRSDRAIVTPIAGTTRDIVSEAFNLGGIAATLLDTAGVGKTEDLVERLGIERSRRAFATAAVTVFVVDGSQEPDADDVTVARLLAADAAGPVVIAFNKCDLPAQHDCSALLAELPGTEVVRISAKTGSGLDDLERALVAALVPAAGVHAARPALITARQHAELDRALLHLREAAAARADGVPIDLMAIDVRAALHAIGQVTGESVDEAVLTEIFSRFCIGK